MKCNKEQRNLIENSMSITMEVGLWWFPNPSKNKIGKYYSYSSIEKSGCQMLILKFMREK